MKVLYRPNGERKSTMKQVLEFDTMLDLLKYLCKKYENNFDIEDIIINYYCYDKITKWHTYFVSITRYKNQDYLNSGHSPVLIGLLTFK